jgi:hypothetical protein
VQAPALGSKEAPALAFGGKDAPALAFGSKEAPAFSVKEAPAADPGVAALRASSSGLLGRISAGVGWLAGGAEPADVRPAALSACRRAPLTALGCRQSVPAAGTRAWHSDR